MWHRSDDEEFPLCLHLLLLLSPPSLPPSPSAGLLLYRLPHPPTDPPPLYWRIRELDLLCSQVLHTTGKLFISERLEQSAATFFLFVFLAT